VLIRPEQLDVHPGADGQGAHGRVISISFHGHDTLISISSDNEEVPSPLLVRVHGNPQLRPGSAVTLSVSEPVCAWPCGDPA
jgi:ABC-type sugar transport system ATPase subunit